MSQSRVRDLKPPVDGMFYEIFGFGTFFRYHNSQNEIDAWESTVRAVIIFHLLSCPLKLIAYTLPAYKRIIVVKHCRVVGS